MCPGIGIVVRQFSNVTFNMAAYLVAPSIGIGWYKMLSVCWKYAWDVGFVTLGPSSDNVRSDVTSTVNGARGTSVSVGVLGISLVRFGGNVAAMHMGSYVFVNLRRFTFPLGIFRGCRRVWWKAAYVY